MILKKKYILGIMIVLLGILLCACGKEEAAEQEEKGYDLAIDDSEREEAEKDGQKMMSLVFDIYKNADRGEASGDVLSDEEILEMQEKIKETGVPVTSVLPYSTMENYETVDDFLKKCERGESGSVVVYEMHTDVGIGRKKFVFDGQDMYVLAANAMWNTEDEPEVPFLSYTRIKEWNYTDKGWFCYKLCVPEPPEVTEIVDGSCLIRIRPMTEEQREMTEKCVRGIGYQGNNLLRSNWDADHMEGLDYNAIYEYLYAMKYQKEFSDEDAPNGIPGEEFESLIMEYLPVTAEQLREYAVYDVKDQTYAWEKLGYSNYAPNFFATSLPEVSDIKENKDGTLTLTVDAVCDTVVCSDAVVTHKLTVRLEEDGSFQYLRNEILDEGIQNIPEYQYRVRTFSPVGRLPLPATVSEIPTAPSHTFF